MTEEVVSYHDVCDLAVKVFGEEAQIGMIYEEMGELAQAINKFRRGKATAEDVVGEIADVMIMMDQAAQIFDKQNKYELIFKSKVERLLKLVNKELKSLEEEAKQNEFDV